uniref:Uncharacterized protein n=1 Tax=Chromera velia CCMP2878 TaxID=1169474 RepID=A0A0G4GGZ5_9ALVE|eukprot:Cvel_21805.t1-p1 / transcript=Cvel_21805.t1 / gene=Cvel_21805 / organism=Chromera_velia_CCMP2878 / gene_product=hypothetical protein / transcript_product=hypothetical protein / location=Cvel_scaffold2078:11879-14328(-) / protein_length=438 / sequence_SO=supercontig / SO=protein_coding / is_pseudo=false
MSTAHNCNKTDLSKLYHEGDPKNFFDLFTDYGYGPCNSAITRLIRPALLQFVSDRREAKINRKGEGRDQDRGAEKDCGNANEATRVVELGSSFGNSTLSYRCGVEWEGMREVFYKKALPKDFCEKDGEGAGKLRVFASDVSPSALHFGKSIGLFDETFPFDFNDPMCEPLVSELRTADVLFHMGAVLYQKTERLQECVDLFLSRASNDLTLSGNNNSSSGNNLSKLQKKHPIGMKESDQTAWQMESKPRRTKMMVYNLFPAFDTRHLAPETFLMHHADRWEWTVDTAFMKHRNFTKEEADKQLQSGVTESWCICFMVRLTEKDTLGERGRQRQKGKKKVGMGLAQGTIRVGLVGVTSPSDYEREGSSENDDEEAEGEGQDGGAGTGTGSLSPSSSSSSNSPSQKSFPVSLDPSRSPSLIPCTLSSDRISVTDGGRLDG